MCTSGSMEVRCLRSMHELTQNVDHVGNVGSRVGEIDELADQLLIRPLINRFRIRNIYQAMISFE